MRNIFCGNVFCMCGSGPFHFIGIGGIGMSALARLCLIKGYKVSGSDIVHKDTVKTLESMGAVFFYGQRAENITDDMVVVYSSDILACNPELLEAKKRGLRILHRVDFINQLLKNKEVLAVTGSHGKTTTSSILISILDHAKNLSIAIVGGITESYKSNVVISDGDLSILEVDESDGTLVDVASDIAVITNIDDDHMNYHGTIGNLRRCMSLFLSCVKRHILLHESITELDFKSFKYGESSEVDFRAVDIRSTPDGCFFSIKMPSGVIEDAFICIPGRHNALNATAAAGMAFLAGITDLQCIKEGIKSFRGVYRRFTHIGNSLNRRFYHDYAHHPKEIIALAETCRLASLGGKVIFVEQPLRYSRLKSLFNDYVKSCLLFDKIILISVCDLGEKPADCLDSDALADKLSELRPNYVIRVDGVDLITEAIFENSSEGDLVVFCGAGNINVIAVESFAKFQSRYESCSNVILNNTHVL